MIDPELLHKVTKRGVSEIIPEAEFLARLEEGKRGTWEATSPILQLSQL